MNGILAKKLGMTQIFDEQGQRIAVTVLEAGPCVVVRHRTVEKDGYEAVQIGFGEQKASRVSRPDAGQFAKAGVDPVQHLTEVNTEDLGSWPVGKKFGADIFEAKQTVSVSGVSKGRGFSGTIKRHNFSSGPRSHGSHNIREPGSQSAHTFPGRVLPGKRLAGQYGNKRVTVKNLQVLKVDAPRNLLFVKGAVPGPRNGIILVRKG